MLDDAPNAAAKLLSAAAAGEIMLSDGAYDIAGLTDDLERRTLELKVKRTNGTLRSDWHFEVISVS